MKVLIDTDEAYPVASFVRPESSLSAFATEVEVDGRKLARWRRVLKEYEQVQNEMLDAAGVER